MAAHPLDIPTLMAVEAGSAFISGLLLSISRASRSAPGGREEAAGAWCLFVAFALRLLQGQLPDSVVILGSNAAMMFGTAFIYLGNRRFHDPSRDDRRALGATALATVVFAVMYAAGVGYVPRALFVSAVLAVGLFGAAYELAREGGARRERSRYIGIVLSALVGLLLVARIVLLLVAPPSDSDMLSPALERTLAFFPAAVLTHGITLGFLVMLRERSEAGAIVLATTDALTGCLNRRALEDRLSGELDYARRKKSHLGVVVVDLDHFKSVNDQHGHAMGDRVLQLAARALKATVRTSDLVARFGGEEFCVILRDANTEQAALLAERLRLAVAACGQGHDLPVKPTASLGVSSFDPGAPTSWHALFSRADAALYRAKKGGRNRVEVASPLDDTQAATSLPA